METIKIKSEERTSIEWDENCELKPRTALQLRSDGLESVFNNCIGLAATRMEYAISTEHTKFIRISEEGMTEIMVLLKILEHHYTVSIQSKDLAEAYDFVRWYLQNYPHYDASVDVSVKALEMVDRLYAAVGLKRKTEDWGTKMPIFKKHTLKDRVKKSIFIIKDNGIKVVHQFQDYFAGQHSLVGGRA